MKKLVDLVGAFTGLAKDIFGKPLGPSPTMNEVWRFCNILPIAPPKTSPYPIKVCQYDIPANTTILSPTYSVHMDQSYRGDPHVFRPAKFITPDGKYRSDDRNIPFGISWREFGQD